MSSVIYIGILFFAGLCWGSFLNIFSNRLMQENSTLLTLPQCHHCLHTFVWHDRIPLWSWLWLHGKCRYCTTHISWLYPTIEFITANIIVVLALTVPSVYFMSYIIFVSALIITIRTDIEYMLISQITSLYMAPVGVILSLCNALPISPTMSVLGAIGGYISLYSIAYIFSLCTGKDGLGQGDMDLMACIGAFTGPVGCWYSLFFGSITGSIIGILYIFITGKSATIKIPFGPFLASGAVFYIITGTYYSFYSVL